LSEKENGDVGKPEEEEEKTSSRLYDPSIG
jgi:hypothetical protein